MDDTGVLFEYLANAFEVISLILNCDLQLT